MPRDRLFDTIRQNQNECNHLTNTHIKHTAKMKWYKKSQSDKNMCTNNPKWSNKEM